MGDGSETDGLAQSLFHGHLTLGGVDLEGHVLSDGRRTLEEEGVMEAFTGGRSPDVLDRIIRKLPRVEAAPAHYPTVAFRVPGQAAPVSGYEATTVGGLCDLFLSARASGPLKKQPARAAEVAEAILRASATTGIVGLVDDATGYRFLRARQSAQRYVQALIAEDIDQWAERFPKEFWKELARLEGAASWKHESIGWARFIVLFTSDAVDSDVGRELRRADGGAAFRPSTHQWLLEVGGGRIDRKMDSIVAGMRRCRTSAEFEALFAKVLDKAPSRAQRSEGQD